MPKISVIVPVYGVEAYLERCVDSLLGQSMRDIEIILIDDGSPDACGEICDRYAARDPRVRVVHQVNAGVSAARNAGLEIARGEYIMFVDSDDWVEPDFCRLPYEAALAHGADLVMFGYFKHNADEKSICRSAGEGFFSTEEAITYVMKQRHIAVWDKLYHRSLFCGIRFPLVCVSEDLVTTPKLVHAAGSIYRIDASLYHYSYRTDSVIHSHHKSQRFLADAKAMNELFFSELRSWGYDALADSIELQVSLNYLIKHGCFAEDSAFHMEALRGIRGFPADWSWKSKAVLALYRVSPRLFDRVCVLTGRRLPPEEK